MKKLKITCKIIFYIYIYNIMKSFRRTQKKNNRKSKKMRRKSKKMRRTSYKPKSKKLKKKRGGSAASDRAGYENQMEIYRLERERAARKKEEDARNALITKARELEEFRRKMKPEKKFDPNDERKRRLKDLGSHRHTSVIEFLYPSDQLSESDQLSDNMRNYQHLEGSSGNYKHKDAPPNYDYRN